MDNIIVIDSSSDSDVQSNNNNNKVVEQLDVKILREVKSKSDNLVLNIFDFDGTLFKSPEPNPALWHQNMIGKLKAMASEPGGLGWFQDTLTLDDPYVPLLPSEDWFNASVLESVRQSIANPDAVTILLTGRTSLYAQIIDRILLSHELHMNHIGLKPTKSEQAEVMPTFDFKIDFIKRLLSQYDGRIKHINVYEDRIKHVEKFRKALEKIAGVKNNVIHINEPPKYLPEHLETELVNKLVAKNGTPAYQMRKNVSYTCALLDDRSHEKIKSWFEFPADWEIKCHHSTMNLGAHQPTLWKQADGQPAFVPEDFAIGKSVQLKVESVGLSGSAIALKVSGVPSNNNIVHITVAHHPKGKPVDSNYIRNWTAIEEITDLNHILHFIAPEKKEEKKEEEKKEETTETTNTNPKKGGKSNSKPAASPKQPFEFPNVSVQSKINKSELVLDAIITEVGLFTYEPVDGSKKKNEGTAATSNNKGGNIAGLVKKHHPKVAGQDLGKAIENIKDWSSKNTVTEIDKIEEYIKNLSLN